MKKVYIVGGKRTAIGKFLGSLSTVKPGDMAAQVARQLLSDMKLDAAKIDEIIIGHQHSAGQGPSIARRIQIEADIPVEVPATTVNMQCGSGMKSIMIGFNSIQAGSDIVMCGGVENMSQVPFILTNKVRNGVKMGNESVKVEDSLYCDGLIDQFNGYLMGITAENVAEKLNVTREEQDSYALLSQNKAQNAIDRGRFVDEIVPIVYKGRKGEELIFNIDESITRNTTIDGLKKLKAAFKKDGTVTAGNASQLNDGAAIIFLASEKAVEQYNLKPMAEIIATGQKGIDPSIMGLGPVGAVEKALENANMSLENMDLIELNEAFAAQTLGVMKELERIYNISIEDIIKKTNVNGGAIALGHPVAASGCRIVISLIYEMMRRPESKYGLASLCIGGGLGTALVIKKC